MCSSDLKLGIVDVKDAIGIFTITPSEGTIIAADVASKASNMTIVPRSFFRTFLPDAANCATAPTGVALEDCPPVLE